MRNSRGYTREQSVIYFMTAACIGPKGAQRNMLNPPDLKERCAEDVMGKNQSGEVR